MCVCLVWDLQVGTVRDYLGIIAIHALELRRQESVALLIGAGMAQVDVDAHEQVRVVTARRGTCTLCVSVFTTISVRGHMCEWTTRGRHI